MSTIRKWCAYAANDFVTRRVKGERYFSCKTNYGVFVRPDRVRVGDYPVEDINFDDDEEM